MRLIVGLGNPGEKYSKTRHNVGFMAIDNLAQEIQKSKFKNQNHNLKFKNNKKLHAEVLNFESSIVLAKPTAFMNESGKAVSAFSAFYKLHSSDIYVIHDDLDIKLGEYKIQKGVGPKVHNGISSIEKKLGTKDFWRVRVGVENRTRDKGQRPKGINYVLQNFSDEENEILKETISKVVRDIIPRIN